MLAPRERGPVMVGPLVLGDFLLLLGGVVIVVGSLVVWSWWPVIAAGVVAFGVGFSGR